MSDCTTEDCREFSYSGDFTDPLDLVRFIIGDTEKSTALIDDREIRSALMLHEDPTQAGIFLINGLITKFSLLDDVSIGPIKKSYKAIAVNLQKRLHAIENDECRTSAPILVKTRSRSRYHRKDCYDHHYYDQDTHFRTGMFDNDDNDQYGDGYYGDGDYYDRKRSKNGR